MRSPPHSARLRRLSIACVYARNVGSLRQAAERYGFTVIELVEHIEAENARELRRIERSTKRAY